MVKEYESCSLGSVQVLHQHFWGGLSQIAETTDALDGQNDDMLTLRRPGVGKLKHRARIAVKCLKLYLNHALISTP